MHSFNYRVSKNKTYETIIKNHYENEIHTIEQVIKFNEQLIFERNFEPSFFIIGLLMYKKINNLPEALLWFEKFLTNAQGNSKFRYLIEKAKILKKEVEVEMSLQS